MALLMIYGRLPRSAERIDTFRCPEDLRPEPEAPAVAETGSNVATRRGLLAGACGLAVGIAAGRFLLGGSAGSTKTPAEREHAGTGEGESEPIAALPDWGREMLEMPAETLLLQAGEFERMSMRHRGDRALGPCFVRVFVVAASSGRAEAPMAAAVAVRTLERVDRLDLLDELLPALLRRPDWQDAQKAAEGAYRRNPRHGKVG